MNKEDTSSPTISIKGFFLLCTIDENEDKGVVTADIPREFVQAEIEGEMGMKLEGNMCDMFTKIDPKLYAKHLRTENGKYVLYVRLKKALCGTLLFWKKLNRILQEWVFMVNPYGIFLANIMINGKRCTILWHVDDLKISHVDSKVITGIIEKLEKKFGKKKPLTVTRGTIYEYLGMIFDFSSADKVMFSMYDYIINILSELTEDWFLG